MVGFFLETPNFTAYMARIAEVHSIRAALHDPGDGGGGSGDIDSVLDKECVTVARGELQGGTSGDALCLLPGRMLPYVKTPVFLLSSRYDTVQPTHAHAHARKK
jgi:hypothetical protein